jgi:DNA polymerase-4
MGELQRKIIHLDMDCFYAAVEIRENPALRGKPLGIGGPANSRSVLTTASYEARQFGIRSAMPSSQAVRLCPGLILIPPRMGLYKIESQKVFEIFRRFTDKIQPLSLDEGYLDVTDIAQAPGEATRIAQEIRRLVFEETQLTISAGVAPNKFLAKIASDWRKPNGIFVLPPEKVAAFMPDLKIEKIPGVGPKSIVKYHKLGLKTCGDLQKLSLWDLKRHFGSWSMDLYKLCRGEDHREVETGGDRKSFTVEDTLNKDVTSLDEALPLIRDIYQDWKTRFEKRDFKDLIDGALVKIKFNDFQRTTKERKIHEMPSFEDFEKLFAEAWKRSEKPVRLLGLGVRLAAPADRVPQLSLFSCAELCG